MNAPFLPDELTLETALSAFASSRSNEVFFPSLGHQDALDRLPLLAAPGSLVVISGESGIGKTLLVQIAVSSFTTAIVPVIAGPVEEAHTDVRFLRSLIVATGNQPLGRTGLSLTAEFLDWTATVAASARTAVIIVDDAHRRSGTQLEILRTLLASASPATPLSLLLLGEPDLLDRLQRKRNLSRRVSLHYALNPLSHLDGANLIAHRLKVAGLQPEDVVTEPARQLLSGLAAGNPEQMIRLTRRLLELAPWSSGALGTADIVDLLGEAASESLARPNGSAHGHDADSFLKGGDVMNKTRNPQGARHANVAVPGNEKTGAPTPDSSMDSNRLSG